MFTENMLAELNKQHNYELYSAYLYMAMEAYFHEKGLSGFANFFKVPGRKKNGHMHGSSTEFIIRKGGSVTLDAIERPEADFESPLDLFKKALAHEEFVTSRINTLVDIAIGDRDHATNSFLPVVCGRAGGRGREPSRA